MAAAAVPDSDALFAKGSASAVVLDGDDCVAFNVTEEELLMFVESDGVGHTLTLNFPDGHAKAFAKLLMRALKKAS